MRKRKTKANDEEPFNEFEAERERLIARNRSLLEQIGVHTAAENFAKAVARPAKKPKPNPKPKKPAPKAPSRRSSRLAQSGGGQQHNAEDDPVSLLGKFVINGECPKCGKVVMKGHKNHLESCQGKAEKTVVALTEEEIAEQERAQAEREATRIQELEVAGLVEFTGDAAKFAIVGSTGKRYTVTLSDAQHKCQCMDFRIRRRTCKHIKLVLKELGTEENPKGWKEGVARLAENLDEK